jgi:hypothetical protein
MSRQHWLVIVAVVVVVVGIGIGSIGVWVRIINKTPSFATPETAEFTAYTGAENAIVVITNLGERSLYWCGRGVVTNQTGARAMSHIVCSGEIASKSTVELRAPYRVGAIKDLCPSPEAFKIVDWDKCDFNAEPVQ